MTEHAYFVGRSEAAIQPPYRGLDKIYGGQRLDGATLDDLTYEHCTFANISFKNAHVHEGRFVNCAFIAC